MKSLNIFYEPFYFFDCLTISLNLLIKLLNCFAMTTKITKTFHVDHPIEAHGITSPTRTDGSLCSGGISHQQG